MKSTGGGKICQIQDCLENAVLDIGQLGMSISIRYRFCLNHFRDLFGFMESYGVTDEEQDNKLIGIRRAATLLGIHAETLRRWDRSGKLKAVVISKRGDRKYLLEDIKGLIK